MNMTHNDKAPCLHCATLRGVHPFGPEVTFRFDPKVNVLIGPNGAGKSAAVGGFAGADQRRLSPASDATEMQIERVMDPSSASLGDVTTVYVGPTRASLTSDMVLSDLQLLNVQGRLTTLMKLVRPVAFVAIVLGFAYMMVALGFNIFLDSPPWWIDARGGEWAVFLSLMFTTYVAYVLALLLRRSPLVLAFVPGNRLLSNVLTYRSQVSSIFMFQAVLAANRRWLGAGGDTSSDRRSHAAHEAAGLALSCAKAIAPEVFPATASLHTGTIINTDKTAHSRWLGWRWRWSFTDRLSTVDTRYSPTPLHITSLSSGTQNTLLIAWYLALSLANSHDFRDGWEKQPAILFLDEIENHLHPAWQRRFIPVFSEHFPNLQIITTTHSPFPIAGLKAGQVHKLLQDDDGRTTVETNEYDIIGWTADEILNEYLDVQDPTDLETAQAVEVLRWLEGLDSLTDEESAESWRAAVVEEFRALERDNELTFDEALIECWLTGTINSPIQVVPPLAGEAEAWRVAMIDEFRSLVGVDILSGGPAARQRQIWKEQMANGTFSMSRVSPHNEHGED